MPAPEILDHEVKARVTKRERVTVERMARARRLKNADIVREALGEYFENLAQRDGNGAAK